ncbi:MAG: MobF family relaxase [Isosphaeraceae bacterium]
MLSVAPLAGGPGYYLALANINYYMEGEKGEPMPTWHGLAAGEFGLEGIARKEHVERLCAGYDPHDPGEKLVNNAGKEARNPGHDLTFSAPKSLSCAWSVADPELRRAIEEKHRAAVKAALSFLEEKVGYARVGTDGLARVKCPLLFALFDHGTSRAEDQQLHTHALLINVTRHGDGRTTAIDPTFMYDWKMAAGAVYRLVCGQGMLELGFQLKERRIGSSVGWELACIPQEWIDDASKRRAEIEEKLALRKGSLDAADSRYAELVAKETRRTKDTEKPRDELFARWQAEALEHGITPEFLRRHLEPGVKLSQLRPEVRDARKEGLWKQASEALSRQNSHWSEADLTRALAERAMGKLSLRDVRELIAEKRRTRDLVRLGEVRTEKPDRKRNRYAEKWEQRFTTKEVIELEKRMLRDVLAIKREDRPGSRRELIEEAIRKSTPKLDGEQAEAVRHLLTGPGIRVMTGIAGSGKTTAMLTCAEVWRAEGREVLGCALAGKAATKLQKETGIESGTLASLLWRSENGQLSLARKTIVLDESGMVGTKDLQRLIRLIRCSEDCRGILLGDPKQLQPIDAGGGLKFLGDILGEKRLTVIRRQGEIWQRQAVAAIERGDAGEAIKAFIDNKCFHLADTREQAMAKLLEQWKKDGGIQKPEGVFLLASTNAEVISINRAAQAARIEAGNVSADRKVFADGVFLHEGDRLIFLKKSKELAIDNGDMATLVRVDDSGRKITVRLDREGREITVNFSRYAARNLALGYCATTHKTQGETLAHCHVLMGGPMTDQHLGYVQVSRSKISTHLFCDKASAGGPELSDLLRALGRERQKTMAAQVVLDEKRREREIPLPPTPRLDQEQAQRRGHGRGISP